MVTVLTPIIDTTENVTSVPIILDNGPSYVYEVLFSIYVPNLVPDDVVLIKSQFQMTGSYPYYVGLGRSILRTSGPTNTTSGTYVSKPVMSNLMPGQSVEGIVMMGIDSGMPAGDYYYNVVVNCTGSSLLPSGETIQVTANVGDCSAIILTR